jgi:hypothetical protein
MAWITAIHALDEIDDAAPQPADRVTDVAALPVGAA